jgi:hypothetical protein
MPEPIAIPAIAPPDRDDEEEVLEGVPSSLVGLGGESAEAAARCASASTCSSADS